MGRLSDGGHWGGHLDGLGAGDREKRKSARKWYWEELFPLYCKFASLSFVALLQSTKDCDNVISLQ